MKHHITFLTFVFLLFVNTSSAQESIPLGNQVWMKKNLTIKVFRNGDTILHAKTAEEWVKAGQSGIPAWCHYENDTSNEDIHGILYNAHAVLDKRGLAPTGWHIPDVIEWKTLFAQYGGENEAGFALISKKHWFVSEWNPPNDVPPSGFEAFGSGVRDNQGNFSGKEHLAGFFTVNNETLPMAHKISESSDDGEINMEISAELKWVIEGIEVYMLNNITTMIGKYALQGNEGYSVRCIKD